MGINFWGATKMKFVTGTSSRSSNTSAPRPSALVLGWGVMIIMKCSEIFCARGQPAVSDSRKVQRQVAAAAGQCSATQDSPERGFHCSKCAQWSLSQLASKFARLVTHREPLGLDGWSAANAPQVKEHRRDEGILRLVRQPISLSMLHTLINNLESRMRKVIELNCDYIGK